MIDTIHLRYKIRDTSQHECLLQLFERLGKSSYQNANGAFLKSNLRNLELGLNAKFLWIKGSLAKFYLGNNITELAPEQIKLALFELSELLQTNICSAEIRRVDVSHCFGLRHRVSDYLACFEDTPEFRKYFRATGQTKTYAKENFAVVLYDKLLESKKHNEVIPVELSDEHILRIELQLQRRLTDELKRRKIYAVHLFARGFLRQLIERWMEEYFSIYTRKLLSVDPGLMSLKLRRQLNFVRNVESYGGRSKLHELIDRETTSGRTSQNQRKYFKAIMRMLYSENTFFGAIPIVSELDNMVRAHYHLCLKKLKGD